MDKSQLYIKMCESAQEIQELKEVTDGNYYTNTITGYEFELSSVNIIYEVGDDRYYSVTISNDSVWLPRQDQLQEMIDWNKTIYSFALGINPVCRCDYGGGYDREDENEIDYLDKFKSFEQSWLAFVMQENYNKVWDFESETWISL